MNNTPLIKADGRTYRVNIGAALKAGVLTPMFEVGDVFYKSNWSPMIVVQVVYVPYDERTRTDFPAYALVGLYNSLKPYSGDTKLFTEEELCQYLIEHELVKIGNVNKVLDAYICAAIRTPER